MDGTSAKKSISLETLVIQNITNVAELKAKLNEIVKIGRDYEYDVSSCLKSLLSSGDQEIVLLTLQAIAELSKCETKRETYATREVVEPILKNISKDLTTDNFSVIKNCCRVLGNLCCDCDSGRTIITQLNGIPILFSLLNKVESIKNEQTEEIELLTAKTLLNYTIGGQEMAQIILECGIVEVVHKILLSELRKEVMNDEMASTSLLILSVINDNILEYMFDDQVNRTVLNVLRESTSIEISEICLDHLHMQAEHDSVKTLLAREGGVQLVCFRLEVLVERQRTRVHRSEDPEVDAVTKQACDLIIIVLTGDEAMHLLYENGSGEVYNTMVRWLEVDNCNLLTTAVLAIGNFARQDDYCVSMMRDGIFERLLDLFESYHKQTQPNPSTPDSDVIDEATATKVEHAVLSALRNLLVPAVNKQTAADNGRAVNIFLSALPEVTQHHVAYKLMAALRLLMDGQESVGREFGGSLRALAAAREWAARAQHAGAAGEAARLLAAAVRATPDTRTTQVDGCISCLVNMLISSHSVMQNEAILALTLLSIQALNKKGQNSDQFDYERSMVDQLLKSEIGKHIAILIDTNSAKMPIGVAENLISFLMITSKNNELASEYKEANVDESLSKFLEARNDINVDNKNKIVLIVNAIGNCGD